MTTLTAFPQNVFDVMEPRIKVYLSDYTIVRRPLKIMDPPQSIGLLIKNFVPGNIFETNNNSEPTFSTYHYQIQLLVKHADEEQGRIMSSTDAKVLRVMLARDPLLQVGLANLSEQAFVATGMASVERVQRFGVSGQSYNNNDLSGQKVFLTTTQFFVTTETSKL